MLNLCVWAGRAALIKGAEFANCVLMGQDGGFPTWGIPFWPKKWCPTQTFQIIILSRKIHKNPRELAKIVKNRTKYLK
jgi:hypothetical protein